MTERDDATQLPDVAGLDDFEAWLEHRATTTGSDRAAVLDDLVAAYWALNEIIGFVDGLHTEATPDGEPPIEDAQSVSTRTTVTHLEDEVASLQESVAALELSKEEQRSDESVLEDEVASLQECIDALQHDLQALEETTAAADETATAYVAREFRHLRPILEHLLDETSTLGRRSDDIEATVDTTLERFTTHLDDQRALMNLQRTAARQGVERASCDTCRSTVSLALLPTPYCPHCDAELVDVETRRSRFGRARWELTTVSSDETERSDAGPNGAGHRFSSLTWTERTNRR